MGIFTGDLTLPQNVTCDALRCSASTGVMMIGERRWMLHGTAICSAAMK
jgi:hypothetical protein